MTHANVLSSSRTLIFGGASGMGAAVSSGVLSSGGKLFISSSSQTNIDKAIHHLKSLYANAMVSGAVADLSNENTLEENIQKVLEAAVSDLGGPLDHIVYTAGDMHQPASWTTLGAKDGYIGWTVRYQGPLVIGKLVAANPGRYMAQDHTSSITFTSGVLGRKPVRGLVANWPGAVEVMARSLAVQIAPVRVNTVVPGVIMTEMWSKLGDVQLDGFLDNSLTKTVGKPQETAEAYLFLMRCGFITGQDIVVDGGYTYC